MKVFVILLVLIMISLTFFIPTSFAQSYVCQEHDSEITVISNKEIFYPNENMTLSVIGQPNKTTELIIENPKNTVFSETKTSTTGNATFAYPLETNPMKGTWKIIANQDANVDILFLGVYDKPQRVLTVHATALSHSKFHTATFTIAGNPQQPLNLDVTDSMKQTVYHDELVLNSNGMCVYSISLQDFSAGVYDLVISDNRIFASTTFSVGLQPYDSALEDVSESTKHDALNLTKLTTPLKQIQSGINNNEIQCKQNLVLIQKYDGTPACVTEPTKTKLVERGWTAKDSSAQKIIERIKQDAQAVNEVDARYIETLVLMNQTVSNFVYGVEWTSHCCGYFENNNSSEITITFLDSDNQKQLGVTFDLDTMQITDIQQSNTVSIGKGLSSEPDPYRLIALREFPNESSYYHKINNISEIPYISKINENKTTITTSEQFNELLEWFPQKCLENNSDSYDCSNTPPIFEYDSTKYLIVSHGLDSNEVYCESGLLHITNYEKEFPDRNVEDFVPVKCVTPPTKDQLFDK